MVDLVTADLQLSDNPRDEYRWAIFPLLTKLAEKYNVDRLFILGDLTEAKDEHAAGLVNRIVEQLHIQTYSKDIIIVRGNHDGLTVDNPFFRFIGLLPHVKWIQGPTWIGDDLLLPFSTDPQKDWEQELPDASYARFVFCHQYFEGAMSESGMVLEGGTPTSIFPKGTRVIAGDMHKPQNLDCVTYVGSPYHVDFGDEFEPRVLLLDQRKVMSVPVELPMKRLMTLSGIEALGIEWPGLPPHKGDILKVRVKIKAEQYTRWLEMVREIRAWGVKNGYVIHSVEPIIEKPGGLAPARSAKDNRRSDDDELLQEFARVRRLTQGVMKVGKGLL